MASSNSPSSSNVLNVPWKATRNFWLLSTVGPGSVTPELTLKDTSNASLVLSAASNSLSCYAGASLSFSNYLTDATCQNGIQFATTGLPSGVTLSNDGTLAVSSNAAVPASASVTLSAINGWSKRASQSLQIQLLAPPVTSLLPTAVFRYDASTLSGSNGQAVTSWSNIGMAGSGFHLFQATASKRPVVSLVSGVYGVSFVYPTEQVLRNDAATTGAAVTGVPFQCVWTGSNTSNLGITTVSVMSMGNNYGSDGKLLNMNSGTGSNMITLASSEYNLYNNSGKVVVTQAAGHYASTVSGLRLDRRRVIASRVKNVQATGSTLYETFASSNAAALQPLALTTSSYASTMADRTYHRICVGQGRVGAATTYNAGIMHEMLVFNTALTDAALTSVMTELRTKWSVVP